MPAYNDTNLSTATNFFDVIRYGNELSNGTWVFLVYGATFFITFVLFQERSGTTGGLLGASAVTTLLGAALWGLNFISLDYVIMPFSALFVSMILFFLFKD